MYPADFAINLTNQSPNLSIINCLDFNCKHTGLLGANYCSAENGGKLMCYHSRELDYREENINKTALLKQTARKEEIFGPYIEEIQRIFKNFSLEF